ncbi:MAG: pyrimidine 5'-nucleotidase [Hyphomicrobiales bacterium]|nr:pyrimidine 5'-nucleotidase [Hyphomicrobiales bacterium]
MAPLPEPSSFRSPADADLRRRFGHVTTWVFDLDNTLYPPESGVWPMINERITLFLIQIFGLDGMSARALHQHYYARHGATLCGLVADNIEAESFLEFVHDIDRSALKPDPLLAREVGRLPGRKLIFTNGSRGHAMLTARQLGLDGLFEDAFDILAARLTPKPAEAAYEAFFARYDIDPKRAAMFEDLPKNLTIPKAKGMTTVLVTGKPGPHHAHAAEPAPSEPADFVTDDLAAFLGRVNGQIGLGQT